jgi:hypothetical protein
MESLRVVRFLIYVTTLAYGLVVIIQGPVLISDGNDGVLVSPAVGAAVGVLQLLAITVGLVVDSIDRNHKWIIKPIFLFLTVTFLYYSVLQIISSDSAFGWIPFVVYTALCSVVYLSEGK